MEILQLISIKKNNRLTALIIIFIIYFLIMNQDIMGILSLWFQSVFNNAHP